MTYENRAVGPLIMLWGSGPGMHYIGWVLQENLSGSEEKCNESKEPEME